MPTEGYISSEQVAAQVAEAILAPIYGAKKIKKQRPFHAHLIDEVWHVSGTLHPPWYGGVIFGGTAYVAIDKKTGQILRVMHEK